MRLSLESYISWVEKKLFSPQEVVQDYVARAEKDELNAYVRLHPAYIQEHLQAFAARPLKAAPIAVKDIFMTEGYETTCGSRILQWYIPPYTATSIKNMESAGGLMIGKANMDEFAMGTSNESSAFWPVSNPRDITRIAGGSSGGSAAAVAGDLCLAALGTDTWGSVRMPAAVCGIVGIKPTYGRISRYGVQALASSLDQVGVLAKNVGDASLLLQYLCWHDPYDATSIVRDDVASWKDEIQLTKLTGLRIALPKQFFAQWIDEDVKERCLQVIDLLTNAGAHVDWVDLPSLSYGVAAYYVIQPAEASTNLSRFDGVRFGLQSDTTLHDSLHDYYKEIRDRWFGDEVKRRILTGTFVLSAWFYDSYYRKAQQVRNKIKMDLEQIYQDYDIVMGATCPVPARQLGEKLDDPIANYLADVYAVIANLWGTPAMSVPCGFVEREWTKLPVGLQLMWPAWGESKILWVAQRIEELLGTEVNAYARV